MGAGSIRPRSVNCKMKRLLVFISCLVLCPILSCLFSAYWYEGANTFWKRVDFLPQPVKNLIAVRQHGEEIWVETMQNEYFLVQYPCSKEQSCWVEQDSIPNNLSQEAYIQYNISNGKCENTSIVYPLLHKIETCITSIDRVPDATWITSVALTEDHQLWIWDQPWKDPFSTIIGMFSITVGGTASGSLIGIYFLIVSATKRKGK